MKADDVLRAIEHYQLSVFGPTPNGVREGTEWYACNDIRTKQGFGRTPAEAVETAVTGRECEYNQTELGTECGGDWDFLE